MFHHNNTRIRIYFKSLICLYADVYLGTCFNCGEVGHKQNECPKPRRATNLVEISTEGEEAKDAGGAPEAALSSFDQEGGCD